MTKMIDPNISSSDTNSSSVAGIERRPLNVRGADNAIKPFDDFISEEKAVALVYNGISHAVMMASPIDLEDFALGFSLSENIVSHRKQVLDIEVVADKLGYQVQLSISQQAFAKLKQQRRQLSGKTGCGLCGIESLQQLAPKDLSTVKAALLPSQFTCRKAIAALAQRQQLNQYSGSVHGAALANQSGELQIVREDIGRHNALDKLMGAISNSQQLPYSGDFIVVSSRASFEMVYKVARSRMGNLVAVSAPTTLAIDIAKQVNMNLIGFVKETKHNIYHRQN